MATAARTLKELANLLTDACGGTGVAVWSCAFGELELRHARDIAQRYLSAVNAVWGNAHDELQAGVTVSERDLTFVPLHNSQRHLVGLLALPVPLPQRPVPRAFADEMLWLITRHVECPEPEPEPELVVTPLAALAEPGGIAAWLRYVYERVMLHFGWNISLVAGLVGVPRATLAARLVSVGARRVAPSPKARSAHAGRTSKEHLDDAMLGLLHPRERAAPTSGKRRS